jgi:hypothetical protein
MYVRKECIQEVEIQGGRFLYMQEMGKVGVDLCFHKDLVTAAYSWGTTLCMSIVLLPECCSTQARTVHLGPHYQRLCLRLGIVKLTWIRHNTVC